jgi:DUF1680 family protein
VVTLAEPSPVTGTRLRIAGARVRHSKGVPLYRANPASSDPTGTDSPIEPAEFDVIAIPYHRWGNRSEGGMRVWLPTN